MGYFIKKDKHGTEGMVIPSGPTSERPLTPVTASVRYNTDTGGVEIFNGTAYVELAKTGQATIFVDNFVGDNVAVTFNPMSVSVSDPKNIMVFVDGVFQTPTDNYTVSGFDITFTSAPGTGIPITVVHGLGSTFVQSGDVFDVPNL